MARRAAPVLDRPLLEAAGLLAGAWVVWSLLAPELDAGSDLETVVVAAAVAVPLLAGAIVAALPWAAAHQRWAIGAGVGGARRRGGLRPRRRAGSRVAGQGDRRRRRWGWCWAGCWRSPGTRR